jgi:hypothetical protein
MTAGEIVNQLEPLGTEGYRRILRNHGVDGPLFGVKVEELKKYQKAIKKDYRLALALFDTGIYDAQYLAGLIADAPQMTPGDLQAWLEKASCNAAAEFAVAWVAADGPHGWDLGLKWIDSNSERTAMAGWAALSSWVSVKDDASLDMVELRRLLDRVSRTIHEQPNMVRYHMNGFVIAVGAYVPELMDEAVKAGEQIGTVKVDMGNTACKVPSAPDYIRKVASMGRTGRKRKTARC